MTMTSTITTNQQSEEVLLTVPPEEDKEQLIKTKANTVVEEQTNIFERDGYLCVHEVIPLDRIAVWHEFANTYFEECFQQLHENGHTPFPFHAMQDATPEEHGNPCTKKYALGLGIKHGFREIVMRSPGRYEMSLLHYNNHRHRHPTRGGNGAQAQLPSIEGIKQRLFPLVPNLLGANNWDDVSLCHLSLVVSTPASSEQSWHADGGHLSLTEHLQCHVANVFIPLQNVTKALGPTEFRPGSHFYTRNLAPMMLAAKARKQLRLPVAPLLQMGDVLIFDYRVLHRGKANTSKTTTTTASSSNNNNRTFLVLTFCKPFFKDILNFPKRSMYETKTTATERSDEEEEKEAD